MPRVAQQLAASGTLFLASCAVAPSPLGVPTALAAHEVCSAVFVAGFDSERAFASIVAPQLGPLKSVMRMSIDPVSKSVSAGLGSVAVRRAVYRPPYGCIVSETDPKLPAANIVPSPGPSNISAPASGTVSMGLSEALDLAFAEQPKGPRRRTYAAVIVQQGRIVAERYAPGINASTLLHGWSMSKSVTNALLGILVQENRLDMFTAAPAPEWRNPADPRHSITADDLLRWLPRFVFHEAFAHIPVVDDHPNRSVNGAPLGQQRPAHRVVEQDRP